MDGLDDAQVILATRQRGNREVGFAKKVHERLRREHLEMLAPGPSVPHVSSSTSAPTRLHLREQSSIGMHYDYNIIIIL